MTTLDSIDKLVELDPIGLDLMPEMAAHLNRGIESSQEPMGFFRFWLTAYSHTDGSQVGDKRSIY